MDEIIDTSSENTEITATDGFSFEIAEQFRNMPTIAKPLLNTVGKTFKKIEETLYTAPAFIDMIRASVPEQIFQAVLTDEQKSQIASGALKLMTKKDGTLMASLIDPATNKIVSTIPLKAVNVTPALTEAMTGFAAQMQIAQIVEEMHTVQLAINEVRQGQESDRLAMAYSCQQKLLQAMQINNPQLRSMALMRVVSDAEDSRNQLMLSQNANLRYIKEQPESPIGKFLHGDDADKINARMNEIRESFSAVNMVSLAEVMAYVELGESAAARQSLQYYAEYLQSTYLSSKVLVQRLDMIDPAPENYWSKAIPDISKKIQALPCAGDMPLLTGEDDGK